MQKNGISDEAKKEYFAMNLKAAEFGLVESMSEVAGMYLRGFGVEKNVDKAIKWFEKAIDEGDEFAAITLGYIYSHTNVYNENEDIDKAILYLSKAAQKNNIKAITTLTYIYEELKDFEKMFEYCQRGANNWQ